MKDFNEILKEECIDEKVKFSTVKNPTKMSDDDLMDFLGWLENMKDPNPDNEDQRQDAIKNSKKEMKKRGFKINEAIIHTNPKIEKLLNTNGFDIPAYPKQGDVTFNGKVVGRMDNFNGLTINSKSAVKAIEKVGKGKIGIWNKDDVTMESILDEVDEKQVIHKLISELEKVNKLINKAKINDDYLDRQRDVAEKYVNKAIGELNDSLK